MVEFGDGSFFSALIAIILIDLVLAGDNAIVIALAARKLPADLQKRAIVWGTLGAVVVRASLTIVVVWLLKIPGLMLAGGLLLLWIAYRLLTDQEGHGDPDQVKASTSFWAAMRTIIVADGVMGLDNMLAVAGAAQGSMLLVIIGLLVSIPIMVWGSTLILKFIERFPSILYIGGAILAWTAAKMVTSEPLIIEYLADHHWAPWVAYAAAIIGVLGLAWLRNRRTQPREVKAGA